jgi:hypothetical protein
MTLPEHPIETPPRAPSPVHRFGTLAVHAGSPHDPVTGAVIEPVGASNSSINHLLGTDRLSRSRSQQLSPKPVLESLLAYMNTLALQTPIATTSSAQSPP